MIEFNLNDPVASHIPYREMTFPDGQPHIELDSPLQQDRLLLTIDLYGVEIVARVTSPTDLVRIGLASDVLRRAGCEKLHLFLTYLMGERMDRPIGPEHPFTLRVVTEMIKSFGFDSITLLDPHSDVAPALLNAKVKTNMEFIEQVVSWYAHKDIIFVAPDAGAAKKVSYLGQVFSRPVLYCTKKRDEKTGKLSGFHVGVSTKLDADPIYLIVDDICDGGGTFVGLSEVMHGLGADKIDLAVTKGIFSKGLPLRGIDRVFTTRAYKTNYFDENWDYSRLIIVTH